MKRQQHEPLPSEKESDFLSRGRAFRLALSAALTLSVLFGLPAVGSAQAMVCEAGESEDENDRFVSPTAGCECSVPGGSPNDDPPSSTWHVVELRAAGPRIAGHGLTGILQTARERDFAPFTGFASGSDSPRGPPSAS